MVLHSGIEVHGSVVDGYGHRYGQPPLLQHMDNEIVLEDTSNMFLCNDGHTPTSDQTRLRRFRVNRDHLPTQSYMDDCIIDRVALCFSNHSSAPVLDGQ